MTSRRLSITLFLVFCFNLNLCNVESSNILAIFTAPSKSHWILVQPLLRGLAADGHNVTLISPWEVADSSPNYRNILVEEEAMHFATVIDVVMEETDSNPFKKFWNVIHLPAQMTNATLAHPRVQNLIHSDATFDLVIAMAMSDAFLGFGAHFNCPFVGVSTIGAAQWTDRLTGSLQPLSYVPGLMTGLTDKMSFMERLLNFLFYVVEFILFYLFNGIKMEALYETNFPDPKPKFSELQSRGAALVLLNSHFSISFPRPYLPNNIEVGGMHVNTKVQPLPANLQKYIDESEHGVILFSLGSNVKPSKMPVSKRDAIIEALSKRKERVIWKWDDPNVVVDKNKILASSWLPQDDILAHPNVKLFITHGGLLSCTESIYHGKPVIGIPFFGDQKLNMARAVAAGWGVQIDFTNLTESSLTWGLTEVLSDERYAKNAKKLSVLFRDQPVTPLETAKYWIEYVIRNKGAPHMRSSALDLNFFQYHNLDVYAAIMVTVFILIKIIIVIPKLVISKLTKSGNKVKMS